MKRLVRGTTAALLVVAASVQIGCGGSDSGPTRQEQVRQVQIQAAAAYACMPERYRSELRSLQKQHDARLRVLAKASLPKGAKVGTSPPAGFRQIVESDPVRSRLLRKARAIYARYSPGGTDYDPGCFLSERDKADKALQNP